MNRKILVSAGLLASVSMLSGCAMLGLGGGGAKPGGNTRYVARDVNTLYTAAKDKLDNKQYEVAAALFDEVERQRHAPIRELVDCGGQSVRFGAVVKGYVRAMRSRKGGDRLPSASSAEHNHVRVAEAPPCNGVGLKISE